MKLHLISFFSIIFFSACSPQFKELQPHEKQKIYATIKQEIALHKEMGDLAYLNKSYLEALKHYNILNYYEGYQRITQAQIDAIKSKAKQSATYHYSQANKYLKEKNYKKALQEYNSVLKSDKDNKQSIEKMKQMKQQRDIKIFLTSLQNKLQSTLFNDKGSFENIKNIYWAQYKLAQYDLRDPLVNEAQQRIEKSKYIKKLISQLKESKTLQKAQKYFQNKEYLRSIQLLKSLLRENADNTKAQALLKKATLASKKKVNRDLEVAKMLYEKKQLKKALEVFKDVLKTNPQNDTSLIYIKKIQMQLKTIKSLE